MRRGEAHGVLGNTQVHHALVEANIRECHGATWFDLHTGLLMQPGVGMDDRMKEAAH
jgi:hypothetical protein